MGYHPDKPMHCPKCPTGRLDRLELQFFMKPLFGQGRREVLQLDQCSACRGIWFDPGELELYLKQQVTAADSQPVTPVDHARLDEKEVECVRCSVPMFKWPASLLSAVKADYCPKCLGVWLDAGEIDSLEKENMPLASHLMKRLQALFGRDRWDVRTK